MNTIFIYSFFTVVASVVGIAIPYYLELNKSVVRRFMTISSGIILGICAIHLIPESYESIGNSSIIGILFGFFTPIFLERFSKKDDYKSSHHGELPMFNIITIIAFSVHSFIDGILLNNELTSHDIGVSVFAGIVAHKIPVSFSLMMIFKTHLKEQKRLIVFLVCFVLMTPLGTLCGLFVFTEIPEVLTRQLTSVTAGIFLYISLIHLYYDHKLYKTFSSNLYFLLGFVLSGLLFSYGVH